MHTQGVSNVGQKVLGTELKKALDAKAAQNQPEVTETVNKIEEKAKTKLADVGVKVLNIVDKGRELAKDPSMIGAKLGHGVNLIGFFAKATKDVIIETGKTSKHIAREIKKGYVEARAKKEVVADEASNQG